MTPLSRADIEIPVGELFRRVAHRQPGALAIADDAAELTYAELDARSDAVAAGLAGLPRDRLVALAFGHGHAAIVALLGAIKAGVPALPLDPAAPPEGLEGLLATAQLILAEPAAEGWARTRGGGVPVVSALPACGALPSPPDPGSPAVVFATSASTGPAKGVVRSHRSLVRHAWFLPNRHGYAPGDRISHLSSFAYAGSVPVIFGGLLSGAAIETFDLRRHGAAEFVAWAEGRGLTVLQLTPSLLREAAEILAGAGARWQPRRVTVGGEAMRVADLRMLRERLGWTCPVVNRLASSEAGIIAEWEVEAGRLGGAENAPVGLPVEDRQVAILGDAGEEALPDEPGEILVRGAHLASGYWGRPDLTAERFRPDPLVPGGVVLHTGDLGALRPDGLLLHLGRVDQMVKIRGYRVELAQVEAALRALPEVAEAVASAHVTQLGTPRIVAHVQPRPQTVTSASALRRSLQARLPDYMVPWRIKLLDSLPLTSGGKIARRALPPFGGERPDGLGPLVPPRTPTEALLAEIWSELFEVDAIGRNDDFHELGGDSLDILHVAACLFDRVAAFVNDAELLEHPRLADMAALVDGAAAGAG